MAFNKSASRRHRRQIAKEIAAINAGPTGQSLGNSVRPRGRAPKGQGKSYAARRAIADRMDTLDRTMATLRQKLKTTRGQKKFRRRDTAAKARLVLLKKAKSDSRRVINAQGGDWEFKRGMVNHIIGAAQAQYLS